MARRSRSRDLAGLAALGALGYMAMRGGKQPVEDRSMMPTPEADAPQGARIRGPQEAPTRFDDDREPGGGGGAYDLQAIRTNQAAAAPVRTAPTPARAAAPAPAPVLSDEAMRGRGTNRASVPAVVGPRSTGRGGATAAELAEYQRQQERDRMRGRGYGTTYKKGGAVKVKKMASGGMTSASKRADGIATKGKTKCKMY